MNEIGDRIIQTLLSCWADQNGVIVEMEANDETENQSNND